VAWLKWRGTPDRGCWHAMWKERDGKRVRSRSRALSRDDATARRMKDELERNLEMAGLGFGETVPFSTLKQKYLALLKSNNNAPTYIERVRIVLGHVERLLPSIRLPALNSDRVDDYKAKRLAEGTHANTVRREVGVIKTAVKKARRWNFQAADLSAVEKPQAVKAVQLPYTKAQVLKLLETAPPLLATVLRLGLYAGLRRMEILALRWADIDWEQRVIVVGQGWRTKNRKPRALPMHPELFDALSTWRENPAAAGEHVVPWSATPQALTGRVVYFLRVKCGVTKGAIHTLRRTFLTELKKKDVDTGKMMRLGGQTTEKVTQGYIELEVGDLREGVERLDYGTAP
jgi:integrase